MPDHMTPEQRHNCMSHIRANDTAPEVAVRRALFAEGYRFRIHVKSLPGTPDIVLPKYRTVIFVNGCFWHGHKGCRHYTRPKTNEEFWKEKVRRNRERDEVVAAHLEALGWYVITVWECELKDSATVPRIEDQLKANREAWLRHCARRKADRAFAREEDRRRRALRAQIEAELQAEFDIPPRIVRLSHESSE